MQSLVVLLLFVGMFVMVHSVYDEKFRSLENSGRVEYRFIPRTFYEEQLSNTDVKGKMRNMFEGSSPWMERNIGAAASGGGKGSTGDENKDKDADSDADEEE